MASTGSGRPPLPHVLIIVENLPVPFDTRVWQEAQALTANGYSVSIICPTGPAYERRFEVIEGVRIYRHPLPVEGRGALGFALEYAAALFWELLLATRVFLRHRFDIIHACNPPDTIFLIAGLFKLLFGTKFVFDHHDLCPELYEAKFHRRDAAHRALLLLERLTFRIADVVISTNDSYRSVAIERSGKAPSDVVVVRSGPNMARIRVCPPDEALKRGKRFLVGYVGVIGVQEGISYLIDAVRHIVRDLGRTDIQFSIVGAGPALPSAKAYARASGLDEYLSFTGRISDAALMVVLNTADVCVNCDEFNPMNDKSTMNKVMEYMALGKPIVQFDLAEGRVSAQRASEYANPNDAKDMACKIVDLLDDPVKRTAMGAFGRQRVETALAWHHQVPNLLAAYELLWRSGLPASGDRPGHPSDGRRSRVLDA